jgi:hypothetical protein
MLMDEIEKKNKLIKKMIKKIRTKFYKKKLTKSKHQRWN